MSSQQEMLLWVQSVRLLLKKQTWLEGTRPDLGIMDAMACKSRVEPRSCGGAVAFSSFEETDQWIAHS
jgi:hypothetical protein